MKTLVLSVFLFLAVACPIVQAQRVTLPIGEDAVTQYQWSKLSGSEATLALVKGQNDTSFGSWSGVVSSYDDIMSSVSKITVRSHASDDEYTVKVDIGVGSGTNVANRLIFYSQPFQLSGGKIPEGIRFPGELEVAVTAPVTADQTHSTVAVWAPDVRWVEDGLSLDGVDYPFFTRNGWQTNCWAAELWGNGWIYFQGNVLSGRQLAIYQAVDGSGVDQYYTLWYDEARTIGDRWSIGTGQWTAVGYSPAPKMVLRFDKDGNILVGATGCTPGTTYAIGASSSIGDPETVIGTSTAGYDGAVAIYTPFDRTVRSKFFTIRPARTGDPSPQVTAVPLGASFP